MPFRVPTFNLNVGIWRGIGVYPPVGLPAIATTGNLTPGRREYDVPIVPTFNLVLGMTMYLLLPVGTDVRDKLSAGGPDTLEVPLGSGRYYSVLAVDDTAKGFPNEYRFAIIRREVSPTPLT